MGLVKFVVNLFRHYMSSDLAEVIRKGQLEKVLPHPLNGESSKVMSNLKRKH